MFFIFCLFLQNSKFIFSQGLRKSRFQRGAGPIRLCDSNTVDGSKSFSCSGCRARFVGGHGCSSCSAAQAPQLLSCSAVIMCRSKGALRRPLRHAHLRARRQRRARAAARLARWRRLSQLFEESFARWRLLAKLGRWRRWRASHTNVAGRS